jgi:hypothetical protein
MPRTFYIRSNERKDFQLEIGDEDKITFGPAIPFPARQEARLTRQIPLTYCLRVYAKDGKTLRAVFPGVFEIRELSVKVTACVSEIEEFPMPAAEPEPAPTLAFDGPWAQIKPEGEEIDP